MRAAGALGLSSAIARTFVTVLQFEAADNRLAVGGSQPLQGGLIPGHVLRANRAIEGGGVFVRQVFREIGLVRQSTMPPREIADAVQDGLPQVRLESSLVARLEHVETAHGRDHGILNNVGGLEHPARRRRQPATRPSAQGGDAPLHQPLARGLVALLDFVQ